MRVDEEGVSVIERVRRNGYPDAEVPHRLDRMTGGVLVVALNQEACVPNESIRDGLDKIYVARTVRPTHAFRLSAEAVPSPFRTRSASSSQGKTARMGYWPSRMFRYYKQMDVVIDLETGRFHQIRAMMKHPLRRRDTTYDDGSDCRPLLLHALDEASAPGRPADRQIRPCRLDVEFDAELHGFVDQLEEQLAQEGLTSADPLGLTEHVRHQLAGRLPDTRSSPIMVGLSLPTIIGLSRSLNPPSRGSVVADPLRRARRGLPDGAPGPCNPAPPYSPSSPSLMSTSRSVRLVAVGSTGVDPGGPEEPCGGSSLVTDLSISSSRSRSDAYIESSDGSMGSSRPGSRSTRTGSSALEIRRSSRRRIAEAARKAAASASGRRPAWSIRIM